MRTVFKYAIPMEDSFSIDMPKGAEILHIAAQGQGGPMGDLVQNVCMWARVDTDSPQVPVRFLLRGTGHPEANGEHVGSFLLNGGALVFHVFLAPFGQPAMKD